MGISCISFVMPIFFSLASGTSVCSPVNRTDDLSRCLGGIKAIFESTSQFWFGTAYSSRCSGSMAGTTECWNDRGNQADSIASRLGGISSNLEFYIDVKFQSSAGSYTSCGHQFTVSQSRNISLDPTSSEQVTPWEVKMAPTITWDPTNDTYALFVFDVGYPINHGIYINIPGNRFAQAEVIKAYHGPQQFFTSYANVYAILVFRQANDNLVIPSDWTLKFNSNFMQYTIPDMMTALNLSGPVALNWMNVIGDAYAIKKFIDNRSMYNCQYLIQNDIKEHNRSFIPTPPVFTVNVDVTFSPPAFMFTSCCKQYSYPATTFKLDPLGDTTVKTGEVRASVIPTVDLTIGGLFFSRKNFAGKRYTLLCVDPDVPRPTAGTKDRPLLHWQVINIENGDLSTGQVVMTYAGPMPPDDNPHYYYFLLYEQQMELNASTFMNYTEPPESRFLFKISEFVTDNNLTLAGATWMIAAHDEYVRYNYVTNQGRNETEVCARVQGYSSPCPISIATTKNISWGLIFIFICSLICNQRLVI